MSTTEEIRGKAQQTFLDHLDHLSSGRIDEWLALFAEDGVLEHPFSPEGYAAKKLDKAELTEYAPSFPKQFDVGFVDVRFLETTDPSLVIAQFRSEGTALSTGNPYDQDYISVVETRDGLITRYVDYWNPLIFLKSLNTSADEAYGAFTS